MNTRQTIGSIVVLASIAAIIMCTHPAYGATIEELQRSIDEKSKQIDALDKEIKELDKKIQTVSSTGQTLQSAIQTLNASGNKLTTEVKTTESKISKADLSIQQTALEISAKEQKIIRNRATIAKTLRDINEAEHRSLIEATLAETDLSSLWDNIETLTRFQTGLKDQIFELRGYKTELEQKKKQDESLKKELLDLKGQLVDQKKIIDQNAQEKKTLLTKTKNEEATYRQMLADKKALSDAFQQEIFNIESQIKIAIDPNSIPNAAHGILSWPLDNVYITQYFGDTAFSRTGVYNGKGHNGLDFRAAVGTPVKAVADGIVEETGNTDVLPKCLSYGKWVFIRHDNGLASVYGHLSLVKAKAGDRVRAGDVIAYSGNTGYAFGPHLHLSLFANQGVQVMPLTNSINCKNARIPVASQNAYLNPLPYF